MHDSFSRWQAVFRRSGWLSIQPAAFQKDVLCLVRPKRFDTKQTIFLEGDAPGGVYGIVSGGIAAMIRHGSQPLRLIDILRPGAWFGMGPATTGRPRTLNFHAQEPSELVCLSLEAIEALVRADPVNARRIGGLSEVGTDRAVHVASDLAIPDSARQISAVLLRVTGAEEGLQPTNEAGFCLTQSQLGEMANASRHHVNRVLGRFETAGWIAKSYNHLRVLDAGALSAFAAQDD